MIMDLPSCHAPYLLLLIIIIALFFLDPSIVAIFFSSSFPSMTREAVDHGFAFHW
eukprot:m.51926 g.51926  ORF g.51926 m.51926 type:complete len:55 (+) comp11268_c0_seq1:67-231(+)